VVSDAYEGPQPPPEDHLRELILTGLEYARRHPDVDRKRLIPASIPMTDTFMNMLNIDWLPERSEGSNIYG
jgi:hypothetical protein